MLTSLILLGTSQLNVFGFAPVFYHPSVRHTARDEQQLFSVDGVLPYCLPNAPSSAFVPDLWFGWVADNSAVNPRICKTPFSVFVRNDNNLQCKLLKGIFEVVRYYIVCVLHHRDIVNMQQGLSDVTIWHLHRENHLIRLINFLVGPGSQKVYHLPSEINKITTISFYHSLRFIKICIAVSFWCFLNKKFCELSSNVSL